MNDRSSLIGFGILIALLVGYMFYSSQSEMKYRQQKLKDSVEYAKKHPKPLAPPVKDSLPAKAAVVAQGDSLSATPEQLVTLENKDLSVTFTNKGGFAKQAELKLFKTYDGKPLRVFTGEKNSLDFAFLNEQGSLVHSQQLTFTPMVSADKKSVTFQNPQLNVTYKLGNEGYLVDMEVGAAHVAKTRNIDVTWSSQAVLTEQDPASQQQYAQICYNLEKEGFDKYDIREKDNREFKEGVKWLCYKQHYFNTTLITENKIITSARIATEPSLDTAKRTLNTMQAFLSVVPQDNLKFQWFAGPNDYKLLKSFNKELEEIIPLYYGIFGFVKYINKWIIIPIFYGLAKVFSNYGVIILLLTVILRILMSPFNYKSYVSSAKMKALKPDLDALKEKLGDDRQAYGMEQMKLYREAGVNPLGGCLPALLQLPVFFALLSFFPHAIELRQAKFLWSNDLSTYDTILNLPFDIPFYGNHVSLFTLLFVITSLLVSLYSMNMSMGADQSNPMMKYMPFIMPIMFLGIFNKLPAALTFYYFVSNIITLGIQFVIQNYIIDPDKIHAQIQAKRNEPPKENKLMKRMMEMQKQNEARMKNKK
ncbi:MAG: membrane protein insertase YidC [Chitinophagaceae bacterium]|nr:membrane protein insertase YidC [Chitinophagaceae bacterium]